MSLINRISDFECYRICLRGDVDLAHRAECDDYVVAFSRAPRANVVLQVRDVPYMDSTGLALVVRLEHIAASRGGHVAVEGAQPIVRRVFEVTGLSRFLVDA